MRLALAGCLVLFTVGCSGSEQTNVERGQKAIDHYGCGACHTIPGIPGARGQVGPPLTSFGKRSIVAGRLSNTEDNLSRWIQQPQAIAPGSAMPNLNVSTADARDIAAYLLSLN